MVGLRVQPHAACGAVEIAGHDIPADAAAGQVIQRRHTPGEQVRRLVGQVGGHAEADMVGDGGHDRHDHHWVVDRDLHGIDDRRLRAAPVDVVDADDIGQEDPVELPAFRQRAKSCQYSMVLYSVERSRGCVHMPCWMWPTQFMSNALRRISFVIARLSGLGGGSVLYHCSGMSIGRYSDVTVAASPDAPRFSVPD